MLPPFCPVISPECAGLLHLGDHLVLAGLGVGHEESVARPLHVVSHAGPVVWLVCNEAVLLINKIKIQTPAMMVSTVKFIASAHWVNYTKETFNKYFS